MSIKDINAAMAMYAQPTEFDQNAWKTAFNIADAFTETEHNRTRADDAKRAHNEMLATSDGRVNYQNWDYANKQKLGDLTLADTQRLYNSAVANQNTQQQMQELLAQYSRDPESGVIRPVTDWAMRAFNDPRVQSNPALFGALLQTGQAGAQATAQQLGTINPQLSAEALKNFGVGSGYGLNAQGQVVDDYGMVVGIPNQQQLGQFIGAKGGTPTELSWQQKQEYQQAQLQQNEMQKAFSSALSSSQPLDELGKPLGGVDMDRFRRNAQQLYMMYPKEQVDQFVTSVYMQLQGQNQ